MLAPVGKEHHHAAVEVLARDGHGGDAERQLDQEQPKDDDVAGFGVDANARLGEAALQQKSHTHQRGQAGDAAADHGQQLFGARADEDVVHRVRREHADEMAEKQEQHTDVEQVATPAQLAHAQHLRGITLPGVLIAVEADQAADEEYGQADVRINPENEVVNGVHLAAPI